jgi:hypothetical protein
VSSGTRLNVRPSLLRSPVPRLLPGFAIFLLSFGAIAIVEGIYDRYHVLDQTNTLFDADPNKVLVNFSTSWGNDTYFRHPWVDFVFSIPVRASAKVHCQVFGCDTARARRLLGLVITPVFGGVKNVLLYIIFTEIGLTPASASLLCAVNLLAFNVGIHLVFYLHDMYLYSLDWGVPLLFMLAGLMRKSGTRSYTGLVIAIVVGSAFASYYALSPFINAAGQLPK